MIEAGERRNGTSTVAFPIKTTEIALDVVGYVGWHATVRVNPRSSVYDQLLQTGDKEWWAIFRQLVLEWNFVNEQGEPLPQPSAVASEKELDLPTDVISALLTLYFDAVRQAAEVPKGPDANSSVTSRTSDASPVRD